MGEATETQCAPPSAVRRIVPPLPITQQTCSDGAEPRKRSAVVPLTCELQVTPPSVDCSMSPAIPKRQLTLLPGAETERGKRLFAVRNADASRDPGESSRVSGAAASGKTFFIVLDSIWGKAAGPPAAGLAGEGCN